MAKSKTTVNAKRPKLVKTKDARSAFIRYYSDGTEVHDCKNPFKFKITDDIICRAVPGDPHQCVVALAAEDRMGVPIDDIVVGTTHTKILIGNRIYRYKTSTVLARAIPEFDESDKKGLKGLTRWNLPVGDYHLLPMPASYRRGNRFHKMKHSGGKKSVWKSPRRPITRFTENIFAMMKKAA